MRLHTHARDSEGLGMRLHPHTLEMVKVLELDCTHKHARDGEVLGMRLHTHMLEMVKVMY